MVCSSFRRSVPLAAILSLLGGPDMGGVVAASAQAQEPRGQIAGIVLSAGTGEPLPFTNIELFRLVSASDSVGVEAGGVFAQPPDGAFRMEVPAGRYRLRATYVSHRPFRQIPVVVSDGEATAIIVRLEPHTITVAPIEVRAKLVRNTETAVLAQQQQAVAVSDAVSSEQIRKTADSDAAEALQRVTGMTVVDSRFVFVRGLGERYSSTQINGSPVGSPEPNKRVIPLDLIPAALLDNVFVQKTYTPDQPAEFGGGMISINTRDFPGERLWSFSTSAGAEAGATGGTFLDYEGGKRDFLGFDDGTRAVPDLIGEMAGDRPVRINMGKDKIQAMGRAFSRIWTADSSRMAPAHGIHAAYGDQVKLWGKELGFIVGGVWDNSYDSFRHAENSYRPGVDGGPLEPYTAYDAYTSESKVNLGGVASLGYRVGEHSSLHVRTFYNRSAEDQVRTYEGMNHDLGARIRNTRLRLVAREVWSSNIGLRHTIPWLNESVFEWRISHSRARRDEPDRREYNYEQRSAPGMPAWWALSGRGPSMGFTRIFGELEDAERGFEASWSLPLGSPRGANASVEVGYQHSYKDRDAGYRRFAFLTPDFGTTIDFKLPPESLMVEENIGGTPRYFRLEEYTLGTDSYRAVQEINASYFMVDVPVAGRLRAVAGLRIENWMQQALTYSKFYVGTPDTIVSTLTETDLSPSVNLTYAATLRTNLRMAYSRTISRPDLRELSRSEMRDYNSGFSEVGNDSLQRAFIHNYDLRYEHYPGPTELIAASAFYKKLIDPIEYTLSAVVSGSRRVPRNGKGAYLYGCELESRLALSRLTRRLDGLAMGLNLTLVKSWAELAGVGVQTTSERPLQGQSPYVVNAMLFYEPAGRPYSVSLVYNRFGKRLSDVGSHGLPDVYEQPREGLDIAVGLVLGRARLKLAAENLLDAAVLFEQRGFVVRELEQGRDYSLSISYHGG